MNEQEQLYALALSMLFSGRRAAAYALYKRLKTATEIFAHRHNIADVVPDATAALKRLLADSDETLREAEDVMAWTKKNDVQVLTMDSPSFPLRLIDCADAPLLLFYKGTADLNNTKVIAIVGTRQNTVYGTDILRDFMADLKEYGEVLVVSGLAYGIDICAHREALKNALPTVAVLAHGLDIIYPSLHRSTATRMLEQGGLLTEYMPQTRIAKGNFVQRNRIIAGMADAVIVVESAAKGGALITADIADSYHRDVFAFPGAVKALRSQGCNNLIRDNKAALITCAADLVMAKGWDVDKKMLRAKREGIARELFTNLSADEEKLVSLLQETNDLSVNVLVVRSEMPMSKVRALMLNLEFIGVVKSYAGDVYHLL